MCQVRPPQVPPVRSAKEIMPERLIFMRKRRSGRGREVTAASVIDALHHSANLCTPAARLSASSHGFVPFKGFAGLGAFLAEFSARFANCVMVMGASQKKILMQMADSFAIH